LDGREVRLANGGIPGFGSALAYFPREGLTVVVLGNLTPLDGHDPTRIQDVRDALARTALAHLPPPPPATEACNVDVYSVGADGSGLQRLTSHPLVDASQAAWSPDGRRILFGSNRDGDFEVYVMDVDGSNQTNLTRDPASDDSASWSPDGTSIAFASDRDGDYEIYVMNADGSEARQLTMNDVEDASPAWSPDGTRIGFTRGEGGSGSRDLYLMSPDGSSVARLTSEGDIAWWPPTWSPDGTRIACETGNPRYPYNGQIDAIEADGSGRVTVVADPAGDHHPAWGQDGRIAFTSDGDIFAIRLDGSERVRITSGWPQDLAPAWSPDVTRIAFSSERLEPVG